MAAPGPDMPPPLTPDTCAEIIASPTVLNELYVQKNIEISPVDISQMLKTKAARNSQLLSLTLTWGCKSDETEGFKALNALMEVFIDQIATDRRKGASQHRDQAETAIINATEVLNKATEAVKQQRRALQKVLVDPDGSGGELLSSKAIRLSSRTSPAPPTVRTVRLPTSIGRERKSRVSCPMTSYCLPL